MSKKTIHLLGLLTLIGFPLISFLIIFLFDLNISFSVLQFKEITVSQIFIGLIVGLVFSGFGLKIFEKPSFKEEIEIQKRLISSLNLRFLDKVFLSFCAGFGEEVLFRVFIQNYLGIILTSILFIAVHGYFKPKSLVKSLYGVFLIPFVLILGFGYEYIGFWFAVAAHFSYDLLIFMKIEKENELDSPFFLKR
jgi:uncharacterized protein